jgi:hypothetical protein
MKILPATYIIAGPARSKKEADIIVFCLLRYSNCRVGYECPLAML